MQTKTDCRFSDSLHRFQSRYAKFLAGSAARLLKSSARSQTCRRAASVYRTHSMRFHRTILFVWMQISVPREIIGIKAITRLPTCRTRLSASAHYGCWPVPDSHRTSVSYPFLLFHLSEDTSYLLFHHSMCLPQKQAFFGAPISLLCNLPWFPFPVSPSPVRRTRLIHAARKPLALYPARKDRRKVHITKCRFLCAHGAHA